ncbi:hypothetical protein FA13DRAFT_520997 [Coprinellus micaceus]|uniref:Uncharacterized protein n=1 Tax=Coprinellus micaceus TaxID=71717 RepID=A0A4Y7TAE7_COPMI|nr:hypothetical protein FA13DRAFT_520997 [Coprinellus micaceus]
MDSELRSLKRSYNTLCFPNQFPIEILSRIFIFCAAQATQQFDSDDGRSFSWVKVAHVCNHWREVALHCPELWSHLLFSNAELAETMLLRSKNAPLSFNLENCGHWLMDVLNTIVSQSHRLRSVEIFGDISSTILTDLTSPTPLLEKLVLEDSCSREIGRIPDNFLGASAPLLKCLKIEDLAIPTYAFLSQFPSLTDLEISETIPSDRETPLRMEGLLEMLQQLPSLESLTLSNCVPQRHGRHLFRAPNCMPRPS